jgi:hypothetical protein
VRTALLGAAKRVMKPRIRAKPITQFRRVLASRSGLALFLLHAGLFSRHAATEENE